MMLNKWLMLLFLCIIILVVMIGFLLKGGCNIIWFEKVIGDMMGVF